MTQHLEPAPTAVDERRRVLRAHVARLHRLGVDGDSDAAAAAAALAALLTHPPAAIGAAVTACADGETRPGVAAHLWAVSDAFTAPVAHAFNDNVNARLAGHPGGGTR